MDDLTKAIDKLLNEKTFTVEAVRGIEELRKRASSMESELTALKARNVAAEGQLADALGKISLINARETAISEREKKMTELEMKSAVSAAVCDAYKDCMTKVLANRHIRESVSGMMPVWQTYPGGGGGMTQSSHNETKDREEG